MKKILIYIITFVFISNVFSQEDGETKSVLFLGNSYTYSNGGIDQMLEQIASSLGDNVTTESNCLGGYNFQGHSTNTNSLSLIASQNWDYVVLQSQSQEPAFPPSQVEVETYPYAESLCNSIYANDSCTVPVFFMTWGRKNGDQQNCASYPPICTYEGMQWRLRQSYVEMAEDNGGIVAPVGMVWKSIRDNNPDIELYSADGSHPSYYGTYLSACTFYSTLFHKSPVGAYVPNQIDQTKAQIIQNAVWSVVTDSLDTWLIDTSSLFVDFHADFLVKSFYNNFSNYTQNADSCFWEFGNGQTQWQYPTPDGLFDNINSEYETEGTYNVCLTAYRKCETKKLCKELYLFDSNIQNIDKSKLELYPNPVTGKILNTPDLYNGKIYKIYSIDGKLIKQEIVKNNKINLHYLPEGCYIIKINNKSHKIVI